MQDAQRYRRPMDTLFKGSLQPATVFRQMPHLIIDLSRHLSHHSLLKQIKYIQQSIISEYHVLTSTIQEFLRKKKRSKNMILRTVSKVFLFLYF
jgi:hypothetical protein